MRSKKIKKWIGIILLAIIFLLLGLHAFISWRARSIFAYTVQQLSDNTYKAHTKKVRFHYFPLGLTAQQVTILPVDSSGNKIFFKVRADSFKIEIGSIWSVITRKDFRMNNLSLGGLHLDITNPDSSQQRKRLNVPMAKVQEVFLNVLTNFKVDHAHIGQGSIAYRQHGLAPLLMNHIFLDIFNLEEKAEKAAGETLQFSAGIRLYLDKPTIQLPDTAVKLLLKDLLFDTRENLFKVNQFRLQAPNRVGRPDSIALSSIRLSNFNWLKWLAEGTVELDSLVASTGNVFFDYSDRELLSLKKNNRGSLVSGIRFPFLVHHVDINQIRYGLRTLSPKGVLTLQLTGDSLGISNFSFNSVNPKPVEVGKLSINVTNFSNNFDTSGNNSTFRKLAINNNDMVLQDFYMNLNDGRFGSGNKLVIPALKVENFSLDALFQYRLEADKLILEKPSLVIDVKKTARKEDLDSQIKRIMTNLRSSLQINELSIDQASINIVPQATPTGSISIDNLSTDINARELLASKTIMDMVSSATALSTSGFQVRGPDIQLEVYRSTLNKKRNGVNLERLKGKLGNRLNVDLHGVELVDEKGRFDFTHLQHIDLNLVKISSGIIDIDLNAAKQGKPLVKAPEIMVNQFEAGAMAIQVRTKSGLLIVEKAGMHATNLSLLNGAAAWQKLDLVTGITNWKKGKIALEAASVSVQQPGQTELRNLTIQTDTGMGIESIQIPMVRVYHQILNTTEPLLQVAKIQLQEPLVVMKPGSGRQSNKPAIQFPDFDLANLEINNPSFMIQPEGRNDVPVFKASKGRAEFRGLSMKSETNDLRVDGAKFLFTKPVFRMDSLLIEPKELYASLSDIHFKDQNLDLMVDTASIRDFNLLKNTPSGFSAENASFDIRRFPYKSGLKLDAKTIMRHPDWFGKAGNLNWQKGDYQLSVHNAQVDKKQDMIMLDSMAVLPMLNRAEYWSRFSAEKDFMTYRMGKTTINGWRIDDDGPDPKINIREAIVHQPDFLIERDKSAGPDTISYRPLLARSFKQIPVLFSLDKLTISQGFVRNNLIPARSQSEAHILFTEMNGSLYNLKNVDITPADSLRYNMQAYLMGQGKLQVNFNQSYTDSLQAFTMDGRMGAMEMSALNPLLLPLMGIRIDKGRIDTMNLEVKANDNVAFGKMGLKYSGLRMTVIRENIKRNYINRLFSWLANLIVRSKSRDKTSHLFQERLQQKSTFNFWGKIAIKGLLTNLGIKTDKKQLRQFEKSREDHGMGNPAKKP